MLIFDILNLHEIYIASISEQTRSTDGINMRLLDVHTGTTYGQNMHSMHIY